MLILKGTMLDPEDLNLGLRLQTDRQSYIHNPEAGWSGERCLRGL